MISFTTAQWDAWMAAVAYPLARVLAFVSTAPFFGNFAIPQRIRLLLGLAIGFGILPLVTTVPAVEPASGVGLWLLAREISVGVAMGMVMRIVFAAINMAGEQIGFQMGLGFAVFYDPQSTAQTPVIAQYLSILTMLVFLAVNGHLMMIATLAQSFQAIPIGPAALPVAAWSNIVNFGSTIFSAGLLLSLPVTIALLITNLALGVLNRVAPQLNLFAIGFPITIVGGFVILLVSLNYMAVPLQRLFEEGLRMMLGFNP